jgi:hypothetical protein
VQVCFSTDFGGLIFAKQHPVLSGVGRTKLSLAENEHIQLSDEELDALESALGRAISLRAEVLAGASACRNELAVTTAHPFEEPERTK